MDSSELLPCEDMHVLHANYQASILCFMQNARAGLELPTFVRGDI